MIDACNLLIDRLLILDTERAQKSAGASLHTMAKADRLNAGIALHIAGENCHGVGIVEEPRIGADLLHVTGKIRHDGNGTQSAEDTADAQRVSDGLTQAVFLGNLKINDGTGLVQADLNGVYNEVCAAQRFLAVFYAQIFGDLGTVLIDITVERGDHDVGLLQTLGINVVQRHLKVAQSLGKHGIAQNVFSEYGAASTHKRNLSHMRYSPLRLISVSIHWYRTCIIAEVFWFFKSLTGKFRRALDFFLKYAIIIL